MKRSEPRNSTRICRIRSARPKLEIVGQKWVRLFAKGQYQFHVLGIWIANRPEVRTPDALARNVTIHVDVIRNGQVGPVCGITSQWVASIDPQAVSHTGRFAQVDIPANENAARCLLLLQHADSDDDCYLHSFGVLWVSRTEGISRIGCLRANTEWSCASLGITSNRNSGVPRATGTKK